MAYNKNLQFHHRRFAAEVLSSPLLAEYFAVSHGEAHYIRPIVMEDELIGVIHLVDNRKGFREKLWEMIAVNILIVGLAMLTALALALWLPRTIVSSVLSLVQLMNRVSTNRDYYIRAEKYSDDELGKLADGFNSMLTEVAKRDRELARYSTHLEKEVAQRTAELRAAVESLALARDRAESANRAKSAFLANMSHELRTPLNAVMGYAQILENDRSLSDYQRTSVQTINRSGNYLLTLINDVLDLAKIEAGRFELVPGPCEPDLFFLGLTEMFRVRAQQKGITFRHESLTNLPHVIEVDEKRLRQVCMNLLGNAVKFTDQGHVILHSAFQNGNLSIAVEDSGTGIAPEALDEIFQPFRQTGEDRYKAQGTGLGLAISRTLTELMSGRLEVESTLGQGSVFRVTIPTKVLDIRPDKTINDAQLSPQVSGYQRTKGEGPLQVLVTDDVATNRLILANMLTPLGFEVHEAHNGEACLEAVRHWTPDLILMDLRMPGMDGLEATRALRARPDLQHTVIFAVSASTFEEDQQAALNAGCDTHLAKPVNQRDLFAIMEDYLPLSWNYVNTDQKISTSGGPPLTDAQRAAIAMPLKRGNINGVRAVLNDLAQQVPCPAEIPELLDLAKRFQIKKIRELLSA